MTGTVLKDPPASASAQRHADWLELLALKARDRNSSIQDIQRVFSRAGTTDAVDLDGSGEDDDAEDRGSERSQQIAEDAFAEIERRKGACRSGDRYPFSLTEQSLQAVKGAEGSVYVFLLLLATFGKDAGPSDLNADEMFEEVAGAAGQAYFGGASITATYQFGFPRRVAPPGFRSALDDLCLQLGEGGGAKDRPRRKAQKDAKLDLALWNDFRDERPGKLIGFAQCATGSNWKAKLTELQPDTWCNLWMHATPMPYPIRAFLVPHSVDASFWDEAVAYGGILFDRTRITCFADPDRTVTKNIGRWSRFVIKDRLRARAR